MYTVGKDGAQLVLETREGSSHVYTGEQLLRWNEVEYAKLRNALFVF